MSKYIHKVHYYETDKMGITHHSNYIRFMEEARMNYLAESGFTMTRLEAEGISSPVVSLPSVSRIPLFRYFSSSPIARSTWLGSIFPDVQALPPGIRASKSPFPT